MWVFRLSFRGVSGPFHMPFLRAKKIYIYPNFSVPSAPLIFNPTQAYLLMTHSVWSLYNSTLWYVHVDASLGAFSRGSFKQLTMVKKNEKFSVYTGPLYPPSFTPLWPHSGLWNTSLHITILCRLSRESAVIFLGQIEHLRTPFIWPWAFFKISLFQTQPFLWILKWYKPVQPIHKLQSPNTNCR